MARLSGLPSQHHHEGPGDAPRRKRGRPNKAPSQEPASTSKRPASPSDDVSQTQSKRTKRTQITDEDQIAEEIEQSVSRSQDGDTVHVQSQFHSTTTSRPSRRYSEPPVSAQDDDDEVVALPPSSTQPQSGLTPHLNRIGAARRDMAATRRARMSMPAQLHIERIDEEIDGTQFQYAPLSAILDSRTRRRLRRSHLSQEVIDVQDNQRKDKKMMLELQKQLREQDEKIKDLEYQLEARRLGEIDISDDHAEAMELQLEHAREEIDRLRASSLYNGSEQGFDGSLDLSEDEGEQLMLVNPDELKLMRDIDYSFVPDGKYTARVEELSSQMTFESLPEVSQITHDTLMEVDEDRVPDRILDQAVERYERELSHYTRRLAESQGTLRILTLELQNLHYLDPGRSASDIMVELRHGFDNLRIEVEKLFPGTTANLTNQQLLQKIPELFGGIFFELKEKMTFISASQKTEILLRRQYEGVLDLLAESEDRIQDLQNKEYNLDRSNEDKQRTIVELEEQLALLTDQNANQEVELKEKDNRIDVLQEDIAEKDTAIERFKASLESYRNELETVTRTATAFETTHHETIARMEQEHADAVAALHVQLANEQDAREAAEGDALQKGEIIDELERRIEAMESEVDVITDELAQLRKRLDEQTKGRQEAESQRDEQAELADEYANKIELLSDTIANLEAELEDARRNLQAERAQRQQTEADLDEANEKISDLTEQLHIAGTGANELRAKLFALQQEKEQIIADLQQEAQAREDDLNQQLDAEMNSRETAENTITKLNNKIDQLQAELVTTQTNYDEMSDAREELEQDRERQVAALNQQLADLKAKYTALETSTNSTIMSLQANITDLNNEVQRQANEIVRLREDNLAKDERYEEDVAALQAEIADLRGDLANERDENERNRKEITSLSGRVETEANELLSMMNSHAEEVSSLKAVISTQEATIRNLQAIANQRAQEHEETITEHTTTIEELRVIGTARLETIVLLETQLEHLKAKFAAQEQDTRETIDALNLAHRRLMEENEALAAAAKERFQKTLHTVQNMKVDRVELKIQSMEPARVQNGKVVKTTEKTKVTKKGGARKKVATRAWRDSGFGVDEGEEGSSKIDSGDLDEDFLAA